MSTEYRVLQYVANPFSGLCFSLAALVRDADGVVHVILAPAAPTAREVGSESEANLLASLRRDIAALDSFDRLPRSFGPQLVLTKAQYVPSEEPLRWVEEQLVPKAA